MKPVTCLDVRRKLITDPRAVDTDMCIHIDGCHACSTHARTLLNADEQLRRAMEIPVPDKLNARIRVRQTMAAARLDNFEATIARAVGVPVPAGLSQRIINRTALERARSRKRATVVQFALAASVAIAVAVGSILSLRPADPLADDPLMNAVVAHSQNHRPHLGTPLPSELITPVLHQVGLEMEKPPARRFRSVTACDVRDKQAVHLVMDGARGPINVYVMPNEGAIASELSAVGENWRGLVFPVQQGSMAVIGHPQEDLQTYAREVRGAFRWRL
jgi:hypothetical protein